MKLFTIKSHLINRHHVATPYFSFSYSAMMKKSLLQGKPEIIMGCELPFICKI